MTALDGYAQDAAEARDAPRSSEAPAAEPLIRIRNLTKSFHRGTFEVPVLHGISLDIVAGEFVAIMGSSGSGKTTLMNLIGLLDRPSGGSYSFAGQEMSGLDAEDRALLRRDAFGFIFQQYNLMATETAAANVEMPAIYAGLPGAKRRSRAREILTQLGLGDRLDHRPSQLSGGQQQRVSIARALMNGGAVILADEPTGALDTRSGKEVMRLLHDLNEHGHTILLITHDPEVAAQAKRVVEIRDGLVVADRRLSREAPAPRPRWTAPPRRRFAVPFDLLAAVGMALHSLRANLMRTVLTLLGIIIGVASVVAMLAIGGGAKQLIVDRITAMGSNLLLVRPGAPNIRNSGGVTTLVAADAEALTDLPNVVVAVPEYQSSATIRTGGSDYWTTVNAGGSDFPIARDWPVATGVFFNDDDLKDYAPVVVLGQTLVKVMFPPDADPLGQFVLLNNIPFQVIGTMEPKGASPGGGNDQDDIAMVPLTTGTLRLFGQRHLRTITVKVADFEKIDVTEDAIRQLLIARHKKEDFQIRNMASIIATATETQSTLTLLLGSIAAISLLVGGIGVMNIMLVSVTERTREIGVRMAAGARRFNILLQFNTEALVLCTFGGLLGVGAGLGAAWAFQSFGKPVVYAATPVILAFGCAFFTGLLFGFLPARKAANLDPVAALGAD